MLRVSFSRGELTNPGALSSKELQRIVIDASHIDQKKRGVLDMRDTLQPLVKLLSRKEFKERYGASGGKLELIFY
jgi:protein CMS1